MYRNYMFLGFVMCQKTALQPSDQNLVLSLVRHLSLSPLRFLGTWSSRTDSAAISCSDEQSLHSPTHVLSNEQISYDHWRAKKPGKAEFLISLGGKKTLSRGQHFQHFVRRVLLSAAPLPSSITTSRRTTRALPKVASCLKCRQALGWPSRSSRWYRSLLLGTVLRFLSCFTGISGCITTTHRIKEVSWTYKTQTSC